MTNNKPHILHIAIHKPVRHCFDYLLPNSIDPTSLTPGARALVPFGKNDVIGVILSIDQSPCFDIKKLKPITAVLDTQPIISSKLFTLYQWASQYYQHPIGEVILGTLPSLLRERKDLDNKTLYYQLTDEGKSVDLEKLKRSPKQRKLIELLRQGMLNRTEIKDRDYSETIISALLEKNLIKKNWQVEKSQNDYTDSKAEQPLNLSTEQQTAVEQIIATSGFKTFLLKGITGSGKTEVYLHIIDHHLKQDKQALVLVPEIGLTPQTISRFQRRFPVCIAAFHSRLTPAERLQSWLKAQSGEARIIIGTRSCIFTPAKNLGVIILDEEHDASFKQQSGFRYSARDLSVLRGQLEDVPVVLGTATPSLETLYNTKIHRFELLSLPFRAGSAKPPIFHTVDIRGQYLEEGLSNQLLHAIKKHLDNNNQALLFLNRRGYAPVLLCHECGWSACCHRCDAKLTLHRSPPRLVCHHCKSTMHVPTQCDDCQSTALYDLGLGTEKIESALQKHFPNTEIIRIDRDTIKHKTAMQNMLEKIKSGSNQILIGTQMLAKGHHFPNVTLVGILDVDNGFYSSDFRAIESTGQLITQVAGRAGRAEKMGEVFLQTHQPEHPLLRTLIEKGYDDFSNDLLTERESSGWPPFSYLTLFRAESTYKEKPLKFLHKVKSMGQKFAQKDIQILGPIAAPMQKKAGHFRSLLLVQATNRKILQTWLGNFIPNIDTLKSSKAVRWSIDVDPIDMF
jgi:primosomal protein N' (replication factor Y)